LIGQHEVEEGERKEGRMEENTTSDKPL